MIYVDIGKNGAKIKISLLQDQFLQGLTTKIPVPRCFQWD